MGAAVSSLVKKLNQRQDAAQANPPTLTYSVQRGIRSFIDAEPPSLDFVWPGFLRRSVGVLVAPGSTGKSFFAIQSAMSVACGRDLFGIFGGAEITKGKVAYIALEDTVEVFWTRIHAIGKWLKLNLPDDEYREVCENFDNIDLHDLYGSGYRPMTKELVASDHIEVTLGKLAEQGDVRLLIIDTYSRFLAGHSEQDNAVASTIVSIIEQMCKRTGAAALILHHTNKAANSNEGAAEQGAARGASALTDNARWQANMFVMREKEAAQFGVPEAERKFYVFVEPTKTNHSAPTGRQLMRRQIGGVLKGETLTPVPKGRQRGEFNE